MNVISKPGLLALIQDKSKDVQEEALVWYQTAKSADWDSFGAVRKDFPDADLVESLLAVLRFQIVCPFLRANFGRCSSSHSRTRRALFGGACSQQ